MADNTSDFFAVDALRRACDRVGGTKRSIAAQLGVTPTALSSLLNGRSTPSMKLLHKMVDVFGGRITDYLELPAPQDWEIKHYRLAAGLTQAALAKALESAPAAVSGWELGKYSPSAPMLPRMAEVFGVPEERVQAAIARQFAPAESAAPLKSSAPEGAAQGQSSVATLVLAQTLAETVLGFAASATAAMADQGIPVEARDQVNAEIRARAQEALGLLATLIPQLPEEARAGTIRLVGKLSDVYEATLCA